MREVTSMESLRFKNLTNRLKQLHKSDIVINPWLAGVDSTSRFDPGVFERLDLEASEYSKIHWTESETIRYFDAVPVPTEFPRIALYETFASTAVFLAHEQTGNLLVDEKIALKAIDKVEKFCQTNGLGSLVHIYRLLTAYDNINAINYFGRIPEREFLLGSWHRPWVDYSLSDDLMIGVLYNNLQITIRDNQRYVELTPKGGHFLSDLRQALEDAGHFKRRIKFLHVSQFNLFDDYEKLGEEIWPQAMSFRKQLIDYAGVNPGMKVLELGCGSGTLTFEAGLADRVGPKGRLVCLDPSRGMMNRAKGKSQSHEKNWVEFWNGHAENLPFEDGSFDAVIGVGFLQFTERKTALKEMRRVTRSGGVIASGHPLAYDFIKLPFFNEWFSPIFELANKRKEKPKTYLFSSEEGLAAFSKAGLTQIESQLPPFPMLFQAPDKVVKHFIHGVGLFQEELADLPWKARQEIIESLHKRGARVCQEYSEEERIVHMPAQYIKGIVP
jgi:ubiquinone/menaquinone biosynthesis C-methylase UbiE